MAMRIIRSVGSRPQIQVWSWKGVQVLPPPTLHLPWSWELKFITQCWTPFHYFLFNELTLTLGRS